MSEFYHLEKPDLSKIDVEKVEKAYVSRPKELITEVEKTANPRYLYWTDVKYRPLPAGFNQAELWALVKMIRNSARSETFVRDESGKYFARVKLDRQEKSLHDIDMAAGGTFKVSEEADEALEINKKNYIIRGLVEEAIASSQLEGAHTTRNVAKKIILEGRPPRTPDERMILNNYRLVEKIKDYYKDEEMTEESMLAMHRLLTDGTDVEAGAIGRFRNDTDDITVGDHTHTTHIPPKEGFMRDELKRFFEITNDRDEDGRFMHPVVKAILLHFWVGYLHPFVDGNGRFARAVFYWYLLKHGYWAATYLPISVMIRKSPVQYSDAYVRSEQDDLDVTYFIDYNIEKMLMAIGDFRTFVRKALKQSHEIEEALSGDAEMNERQKSLLGYLATHPVERITIQGHANRNGVTLPTSRKDLYELEKKGYLEIEKSSGHFVRFFATKKALDLLKK